MIYPVILLFVVALAQSIIFPVLIFKVLRAGQEERSLLEDRLMAMANPNALTTTKAYQDEEPGSISYMDDEAMVAKNGDVDLLGDD